MIHLLLKWVFWSENCTSSTKKPPHIQFDISVKVLFIGLTIFDTSDSNCFKLLKDHSVFRDMII